jgi:glycosyltransferase involved in cell wall biosynthesis
VFAQPRQVHHESLFKLAVDLLLNVMEIVILRALRELAAQDFLPVRSPFDLPHALAGDLRDGAGGGSGFGFRGVVQILNLGPDQDRLSERGFAVRNWGVIDDMNKLAAIYAAADIFVMPSLEENLANVMLEAMACATPVLGFAAGGTPDVIQDGVTGFLAPVSATEQFAARLLELAFNRSLRERMGKNCRALIEQRFKLGDQAANYMELFRDLLEEKRKNDVPAVAIGVHYITG